mgnify:CR=1 FL=1
MFESLVVQFDAGAITHFGTPTHGDGVNVRGILFGTDALERCVPPARADTPAVR